MGTIVAKLSEKEIADRLPKVPGWTLDSGKLYREFRFSDFIEAFGFMTRIAVIAQAQDHHPEWFNVYSTVRIHLSTHDAGGISERDFRLATEINARFDGSRARSV